MTQPATSRLYLNDSLALDFEATVLQTTTYGDHASIILDQSSFYPEGGGQPGDTGTLNTDDHLIKVVDVQVDKAGLVHHLLPSPNDSLLVGCKVSGRVDKDRRTDYMSQHTGQHMLSALVEQELGMPTISARLGSQSSTIDVDGPPERFTPEAIANLESQLNALVLEDRPVETLYPNAEELTGLGLRRAPKVTENIRIIAVERFDATPCGGTHCMRTGQVGPIKILSRERYKGLTRLSFLAGKRTLDYYAKQDQLLGKLCKAMGCAGEELGGHFQRLQEELKQTRQQLGHLRGQAIRQEVAQLLEKDAAYFTPPKLFVREGEDLRTSRQFAASLAANPNAAAIILTREASGDDWRAILMSGDNQNFDCGAWFRGPGKQHGARGGGKPQRAEGILPHDCALEQLTFEG